MTAASPTHPYRAVIFDLGGVITGSPIQAMSRYERERGMPEGRINRLIADLGAPGAWARHERGEIDFAEFSHAFEHECAEIGIEMRVVDLFASIREDSGIRPAMIAAIAILRSHGLKTAACTNNWVAVDDNGQATEHHLVDLRASFDVFIESSVTGLRKPDPRIYHLVCDELGVEPHEAIFLDDIGMNVKGARALGITTIKVGDPEIALDELGQLVGLSLRG